MTDIYDHEHCIDCNPGAAHLGDTTTIRPGEWTPLDEIGTEIYVYGDQPVDIAVQTSSTEDEVRHLRNAFDSIARLLDDYRGQKALREGAQAIVDRARANIR